MDVDDEDDADDDGDEEDVGDDNYCDCNVDDDNVHQVGFEGARPFIACPRLLSLQESPPCKNCKVTT